MDRQTIGLDPKLAEEGQLFAAGCVGVNLDSSCACPSLPHCVKCNRLTLCFPTPPLYRTRNNQMSLDSNYNAAPNKGF